MFPFTFFRSAELFSLGRIAGLLFLLVGAVLPAAAQRGRGECVVMAGSALSFASNFNYLPLNFTFDYGVSPRASMGLGYSMDFMRFNTTDVRRDNYGVRMLGHFGKSPNWDFYMGVRAGGNYWVSSLPKGTNLGRFNNPFQIVSARAATFTPSAQVLMGTRYHFQNWLGLTFEAGIGPPYFLAAGLSCNLSQTRNACDTIGKLYRRELLPVEQKNIVKINIGSLAIFPGVAFERYLNNRFTVEAGASAQLKQSVLISASDNSITGVLRESDSLNEGLKIYGMLRYYMTASRRAVPGGWYTGLVYSYEIRKTLVKVEDLHPVQTATVYDYEKQGEQHGAGPVIGYQRLLGKHFAFDFFTGFQGGAARWYPVSYTNPQVSETDFNTYFGGHIASTSVGFRSFLLKCHFGYRF